LQMPPPPPPAPPPPAEIQVVENDQEVADVVIKSVDIEDAPVEIVDAVSDVGEQVDNTIYTFAVVESVPVYPGCEKYRTKEAKFDCFQRSLQRKFKKYFNKNLDAERGGSGGRVFVHFVIEKDGSISDIQVARAPNDYLKKLSIDFIRSLPRMVPAKQRGQPVRLGYTLPITIRLQ
ncbi:MAG: energy transducer TonB, partial [Flavobacteriales bacterium]